MSKSFLDATYQGKNHWWLYLLVILAIELYWWLLSGYIAAICQVILSLIFPDIYINYYIASSIPFVFLLAILVFAVKRLHCRKFYSLINADSSIKTKRLFMGFGVWGLQLFIFTLYDLLIHPQDYIYNFDPKQWFLLLPFVLILTPIQTSTEELLYRGYLMQGLRSIAKHPLVLILVTSLAFAVPHFGNPEMQRGVFWMGLTYFTWGVFLAAITLKDNGLELALGVHAVNNLFSFLIVNTPDSALPTPTLLTFGRDFDAKEGFFSLLIQAGIFYAVFFGGIPRNSRPS